MQNNKKTIILLYGASGSGKSFLVKALNMKEVISHTTRPIRLNEIDGVDKIFEKEYKAKDVIAYTKRGEYHYWTTKKDLKNKDVYVIDIPGIVMLLKSPLIKEYNFVPVLLNVSILKRIKNMYKRGESIKNILNRLYIDFKAFKNAKSYAKYIINM